VKGGIARILVKVLGTGRWKQNRSRITSQFEKLGLRRGKGIGTTGVGDV